MPPSLLSSTTRWGYIRCTLAAVIEYNVIFFFASLLYRQHCDTVSISKDLFLSEFFVVSCFSPSVRRPAAESREKVPEKTLWVVRAVVKVGARHLAGELLPLLDIILFAFFSLLDNTCAWMARLFGTGRPTSAIRCHLDSGSSNNIAGPAVWKSKEKTVSVVFYVHIIAAEAQLNWKHSYSYCSVKTI